MMFEMARRRRTKWVHILAAAFVALPSGVFGQAVFTSSDTALEQAFVRARDMALSYRGPATDPVGPWYEAALPARAAFCVRDVSHQLIGAEVLGMQAENRNMLNRFLEGISESKDWCTFWEIHKSGRPAVEDYRNDKEFWYNLNANFELIYAGWRMYMWTGDTAFINSAAFRDFSAITVGPFVDRWHLRPEALLNRPAYPNAPVPFNEKDYFHRCRGLPSYYEAIADMGMGADLVAAMYRGFSAYADIAGWRGDHRAEKQFRAKAEAYRQQLETKWWDGQAGLYNTYFTHGRKFGKGEGETFLLWYDALKNGDRVRKTIANMGSKQWNVENLSYLSYQFSRFGYFDESYRFILYLTDPATPRREYPEVSFGVMEGIVQGLMGVSPDGRNGRLTTVYNSHSPHFCEIAGLKVLSSDIRLRHEPGRSVLKNEGSRPFTWRAAFNGRATGIRINGKKMKTRVETDVMGNSKTWAEVELLPGMEAIAEKED